MICLRQEIDCVQKSFLRNLMKLEKSVMGKTLQIKPFYKFLLQGILIFFITQNKIIASKINQTKKPSDFDFNSV